MNGSGRQFFWNTLLKTSLFGEFSWRYPKTALLLSMLLLWFIGFFLANTALNWRYYSSRREWWVFMALLWIPLLALMRSRYLNTYACTQDFRYIYPALIAFSGLLGMIMDHNLLQKRYINAALIGIPLCVFSCTSLLFFLLQ